MIGAAAHVVVRRSSFFLPKLTLAPGGSGTVRKEAPIDLQMHRVIVQTSPLWTERQLLLRGLVGVGSEGFYTTLRVEKRIECVKRWGPYAVFAAVREVTLREEGLLVIGMRARGFTLLSAVPPVPGEVLSPSSVDVGILYPKLAAGEVFEVSYKNGSDVTREITAYLAGPPGE